MKAVHVFRPQAGWTYSFRTATLLAFLGLALAGCASMNRTEEGAVIGAAAGGILGGMIDDNTTRGAIIGAVVGGSAGAIIGRQMDQQAAELEEDLANAEVERIGEGIRVTFESGILFPFDSSELQSAARQNLEELSQSLKEYPNTEVLVVGHTDSSGTDAYNQGLSERRAGAAADYMVQQGVGRSRIRSDGRGESEPRAANDDEVGRQLNRRVEVAIVASEEFREEIAARYGTN
jgi:outer membrane protein OmpA-like peptidoglycan-associated protein